MKELKTCKRCGKTKNLEDFGNRGKETDRFGNPSYRGKCKRCEAEEKTEKNRQKRAEKEASIHSAPKVPITYYEAPKNNNQFFEHDDYSAWSDRLGRELTDEDKDQLDSCARELIVAMMDLVIKEKGNFNE